MQTGTPVGERVESRKRMNIPLLLTVGWTSSQFGKGKEMYVAPHFLAHTCFSKDGPFSGSYLACYRLSRLRISEDTDCYL